MSKAEKRQPFILELAPSQRDAGGYHWAIRKHGKLVQRSDTPLATEAKAWSGLLTVGTIRRRFRPSAGRVAPRTARGSGTRARSVAAWYCRPRR